MTRYKNDNKKRMKIDFPCVIATAKAEMTTVTTIICLTKKLKTFPSCIAGNLMKELIAINKADNPIRAKK